MLISGTAYSADLRDFKFSDKQTDKILDSMENNPEEFFHVDVEFSNIGPSKPTYKNNSVYGVELRGNQLIALIRMDNEFFFRYLSVDESGHTKVVKDVALRDISFKVKVSLSDRLLVLENEEFGIQKVYPIGVGSLNEGFKTQKDPNFIQSLSPEYVGASIKRAELWLSRTSPKYYRGRPFVRVTSPRGNYTAFGFHIVQDTGRYKDVTRGFTSRGCIRMRENDLYELAMIVKYGKLDKIPLNITYDRFNVDHPVKKVDNYYYRPKNFGTKKNPEFRRDPEHNLLILEKVKKPVPYDKLRSVDSNEEQQVEE